MTKNTPFLETLKENHDSNITAVFSDWSQGCSHTFRHLRAQTKRAEDAAFLSDL